MTHPYYTAPGQQINKNLDRLVNIFNLMSDTDRLDLLLKMQDCHNEKRGSNRKNFFGLINYSSKKGGHCDFIRNISEDGVFIETPHYLYVGEPLSLTFSGPTSKQHIKVNGIVARKTAAGVGVQFNPVDQQQKEVIKNLYETI